MTNFRQAPMLVNNKKTPQKGEFFLTIWDDFEKINLILKNKPKQVLLMITLMGTQTGFKITEKWICKVLAINKTSYHKMRRELEEKRILIKEGKKIIINYPMIDKLYNEIKTNDGIEDESEVHSNLSLNSESEVHSINFNNIKSEPENQQSELEVHSKSDTEIHPESESEVHYNKKEIKKNKKYNICQAISKLEQEYEKNKKITLYSIDKNSPTEIDFYKETPQTLFSHGYSFGEYKIFTRIYKWEYSELKGILEHIKYGHMLIEEVFFAFPALQNPDQDLWKTLRANGIAYRDEDNNYHYNLDIFDLSNVVKENDPTKESIQPIDVSL